MGRTVSPVFDVPHGKTSGFSTALCSHPRAVLHCSVGVLACLDAFRNAMPHDMFVRNGQAMLGDGVAWFGAKGVQTINVP